MPVRFYLLPYDDDPATAAAFGGPVRKTSADRFPWDPDVDGVVRIIEWRANYGLVVANTTAARHVQLAGIAGAVVLGIQLSDAFVLSPAARTFLQGKGLTVAELNALQAATTLRQVLFVLGHIRIRTVRSGGAWVDDTGGYADPILPDDVAVSVGG